MFDRSALSSVSGAIPGTGPQLPNESDRKKIHFIEDIYDPDVVPANEAYKYVVPRENELVIDVPNSMVYRVAHVDTQGTLKSTLVPWKNMALSSDTSTVEELEMIYGLTGGFAGECLLTVDYTIQPNRAVVDKRIVCPGASYGKVFKGVDLSENGKVISVSYDSSNHVVDNRVPVTLAEIKESTNLTVMMTDPFSLTLNAESLPNGSRATLAFYDKEGNFLPPAWPLGVQHSGYMRDHNVPKRYITSIELVCPWFTNSVEPEVINVPLNVTLASIEFRAIAHYSDGTNSGLVPVNGGNFSLLKLNLIRPTTVGQRAEIVLRYTFNDDEDAYIAVPGSPGYMTKTYQLCCVEKQGAFSPKIYTYPVPNNVAGYDLRHFLYDLDRQVIIDVTDKVTFNDKSATYNPTRYGVEQDLILNLRLSDASPNYSSWIHTQNTTITLFKPRNEAGKKWSVKYSYTTGLPAYTGLPVTFTKTNNVIKFNISNGFTTVDDWLNALYYSVEPLYFSMEEEKAPKPTHFRLRSPSGTGWLQPVSAFNTSITINETFLTGSTLFLEFLTRKDDGTELQLGMSAVYVVS